MTRRQFDRDYRGSRDPYPFHRPGWQGHGQGHKPSPAPRASLGFWGVLAMIVLFGVGTASILWLVLCWGALLRR
jgi:hypothetical protein